MTTVTRVTTHCPVTIDLKGTSKNIVGLLKKLKESSLFTDHIHQWEKNITQLDDPQKIAEALRYLLTNAIHPTISSTDDDNLLDQLLEFEDEIKELIGQHIDKDVDQFIKEPQDLCRKIAFINMIYEIQIELLQLSANKTNQYMESIYQKLKERLLTVINNRYSKVEQLDNQVNPLLHKLDRMIVDAKKVENSARENINELIAHMNFMSQTINQEIQSL